MDNEKGCPNCFYENFDGKAYPCSMCIRGLKREDMWKPEATGKGQKHEPWQRVVDEDTEDCQWK